MRRNPNAGKKGALSQNKKAWNFGGDVEIPGHKATSVRKVQIAPK